MKSIRKSAPIVACVSIFTLGALLLLMSPAPSARLWAQIQTTTTSSGGIKTFPIFNPPPCDFNDLFYQENGISAGPGTPLNSAPAARFGLFRQTGPPAFQSGQLNWVNDNTCGTNDPTRDQSNDNPARSGVRILATTAAYKDDDGAPTVFFSLIAFLLDQTFFSSTNFFGSGTNKCPACNVRGFREIDIVANFEAYGAPSQLVNGVLAPTPCGSLHSPAIAANDCFPVKRPVLDTPTLRQDWRISSNRNAIDGSSNGAATPFGYFCDDLLGAWIVTYFWYTENSVGGVSSTRQKITPTPTCNTVLAQAAKQNGTNLDGTPIIHTGDELHFIEGIPGTSPQFGFSQAQTTALLNAMAATGACGAEGNLDPGGSDGGAVWLSCPTILDPRNGAIAQDAFLDVVRVKSGNALDSRFQNNFSCLQSTGKFCNE